MIETLEDWNDQLISFGQEGCECCPIAGQDGLGIVGESLSGFIQAQGFSNAGNLYLTRTTSYTGGGSVVSTYDSEYACSLGGQVIEALGAITTVITEPRTGGVTTTYTGLINIAAALSSARSAVEASIDWATMDKGTVSGAAFFESSGFDNYRSISFNRTKFRKVDYGLSNPPGSYLKVTFDIIDFLEDTTENVIATDQILDWTGTFDISDQNNPAHYTDWFYIDPPADPGAREMRNLVWTRFQTTRYGNKPQISDANGDTYIGGIFGPYP